MSGRVTDPKRGLQIEAPPGATHFAILRVTRVNGAGRQEKMLGEPDESGYIPDNWPVEEFSTRSVLARWGEGKYRVEWYGGSDSAHMKGKGTSFEVAAPKSKRPSRKLTPSPAPPSRDSDEPTERAAAQIASGSPIGFLEIMALMRQEREDQRERGEAQAERDRQFWMQMQQQQTQLLQTLLTRGGGGGGADGDLLKRELSLQLEQKMFELRQEMSHEEPEEPSDGAPDPPKDIEEAAERIGMAFLSQLEGAAPELVQKMIPRFLSMLKAQGMQPSAEMQARIAAAANGAHRG